MIHNENPGDQLDLCLKALNTLTYALESCDTNSFACTSQIIEWSIRDAVERIQAKHKAELERFSEAALYLSTVERGELIEKLKATAV